MSYLDMALRAKKEESTQDNPHNLIDETIKKIEMVWLLAGLQKVPKLGLVVPS